MSGAEREALEAVYLAFVDDVLARARGWVAAEGIPVFRVEQVRYTDAGQEPVLVAAVNWWQLFRAHQEELWGADMPNRCARAHAGTVLPTDGMTDAAGNPIPDPTWDQLRPHMIHGVLFPLVEALDRAGSLDPPRDLVLTRYRRFCDLRTGVLRPRYAFSVPLINCTTDLQTEEPLSAHLAVAPLTADDKTRLAASSMMIPGGHEGMAFSQASVQLRGAYEHQGGPHPDPAVSSDITAAVTALRLAASGDVGASWYHEVMENEVLSGRSAGELADLRGAMFGLTYTLRAVDLARVRGLTDALRGRAGQALRLALRRFNLSYGRRTPEDRIIDLAIALESALRQDPGQELSYRIQLRGAAALSAVRDPADTARLLAVVYQARNQLVHSGEDLAGLSSRIRKELAALPGAPVVESLPDLAAGVARDLLAWFAQQLHSGVTMADLTRSLDARIVGGLRTR